MPVDVWFNALALRPGGSGVQTYIRELLNAFASARQLTMTAAVQTDAIAELPQTVRRDERPVCAGARRAWEGMRPARGMFDVVHGLDVDLPIWVRGAATVATVHDCAVVDVPWAFSANRARAERLLLARTARFADEIVTPSAFTAERIWALYGRRAHVTPLAAGPWAKPPAPGDVARVRRAYGLPERFVLQVGTAEPRKLTALLIAAAQAAGVPVVLAGMGSQELSGPGVLGLGHVPGEDLPALFAAASLVAYLTAYEGFGLPPLEAMACGAAVIASNVAPIPEVLGDAALLVPNSLPEVTAALREAISDPDAISHWRDQGSRRAREFSWHLTAARTTEVYGMLR